MQTGRRSQNQDEMFVALGAAFSLGGALMAALATSGYRRTYRSIEEGEYGGSAVLPVVLGAIPIVLGLVALALIAIR